LARPALPASTLASLALHGALFALLWRAPPPRRFETVRIDVVETAPKPPPIEAPPRPRIVEPKVAAALPPDAPERRTPEPEAPPPPNEAPPPDAAPPAKAPVKIGISLSSTTATGGFAAPVGNTLYGKLPEKAPSPDEVKPYVAERYVPPTQVTVLPRGSCEIPKAEYPPDALAQGIEGRVVLRLLIDETGQVMDAIVIDDPGHGFGPAAARSTRRCRFQPGRQGDRTVATWIRYTVSFEIQ